jgi:hypothetical protein
VIESSFPPITKAFFVLNALYNTQGPLKRVRDAREEGNERISSKDSSSLQAMVPRERWEHARASPPPRQWT